MQARYGIDLRQACYGPERIGVRRLHAFVYGLPKDSSTFRALDPNKGWTQTDELIASLIQVVDEGNRLFLAANVKQGTRLPEPIQIRRPWEEEPQPKMTSVEDMKTFLGARYMGRRS